MLSISLQGDKELIARLSSIPDEVRKALLVKITDLTINLEARVKEKVSGEVLHVRTGALHSGIFSDVKETDTSITGRVSAPKDVPYAAIHEFGGIIHIPDIFPTKAKALHFMIGGEDVFAKHVRAHDVHMPERSYLRSSLADMKDEIVNGIKEAVLTAVKGTK